MGGRESEREGGREGGMDGWRKGGDGEKRIRSLNNNNDGKHPLHIAAFAVQSTQST